MADSEFMIGPMRAAHTPRSFRFFAAFGKPEQIIVVLETWGG